MKHEGWPELASRLHVTLPDRAPQQLDAFEELLRSRAIPLGMIGAGDVERIRERHLADALRAVSSVPVRSEVADLGSGAGLPGVPLAIARPDVEMTLVEIRRKRAAFLELVVDTLELSNVSVFVGGTDEVPPGFDVCVARAFAPPRVTWEVAERLLDPGGLLLYWAGDTFEGSVLDELAVRSSLVTTLSTSTLAEAGPIVIMTRQ